MTCKNHRTGLYAGASAVALVVGLAFTPAHAFDTVHWTWNARVWETICKDVDIDINLDPTGLVMLEDLQISIGDITATSTVNDIDNNQPGTKDRRDGKYDFSWKWDHDHDKTKALDALDELPSVVSAATAVANNTNIQSDTAVELHEGQFAFNTYGKIRDGGLTPASTVDGGTDGSLGGNSNQEIAGLVAIGAVLGILQPAEITATSTVYDIKNASVDSSATAVGNNLNVTVQAKNDDDRLFMGDVTQVSVANVTATSDVYDVSLSNYSNLGKLKSPIVSSVATAIGNNKSITVSAPGVKF